MWDIFSFVFSDSMFPEKKIFPFFRMISRVACSWVSDRRWDVRMIDFFCFCMVSRKCQRSLRFLKSRPLNGSSRIMMSGLCRSERIMFSLTCCPPDSWFGNLLMSSSSRSISISFFAWVIPFVSLMPVFRAKILMLSRIEMSGMNDISWGVKPILFLFRILFLPKILILPV
jgi:hypothetical protein